MICPKCKRRMTGADSFNDPDTMQTARFYKCECGNSIHTMEMIYDTLKVSLLLSKRREKRRKRNE